MDTPSPLSPVDPNLPSRYSQGKSPASEKPPPAPPAANDNVRSETSNTGHKPSSSPVHAHRPSIAPQVSFQRPFKKFVWGNKVTKVALPLENEQGRRTCRDSYLRPNDIEERMKQWEEKGFNTDGFGLGAPQDGSSDLLADGQSRAIHPHPSDEIKERNLRRYRVSIPDRREWEAYVNFLKEEKLRALGVSFAEEEQHVRKSPAPSLMSRGASSQGSSMLMSPPLGPTSLANANGHPGKPGVSHFPRFSVVAPFGDKAFSPSHQLSQAQSPISGPWSPQPFAASQPSQPGSRVASPTVNGKLPHLVNSISPVHPSSLQHQLNHHGPQDPSDLLAIMRQQQSQIQNQQQQQQQQIQERMLQLRQASPEKLLKPDTAHYIQDQDAKQPEILTPVPRGHRQNPSESLQREVEEAEAMLEAQADLESAPEAQQGASDLKTPAVLDARDEQMNEAKVDEAILERQNSNPFEIQEVQDSHTDGQRAEHVKTASASKLNVNAPEFKLEAKQSISPSAFSSSDDPTPLGTFEPTSVLGPFSTHAKKQSLAPTKASRLNVGAPAFTPQSLPRPLLPSGEFKFSSSGPTFNPDAPSFNPKASIQQPQTVPDQALNAVGGAKKIFGEFKLPEVVKPSKASKALPIIKPGQSTMDDKEDTETQEDESGRIVRSHDRQKRARRERSDGDQVPLFEIPKQDPLLHHEVDDRAAYFEHEPSTDSEEDHSKTLTAAKDLLEGMIGNLSASEISSANRAAGLHRVVNRDSRSDKDSIVADVVEQEQGDPPSQSEGGVGSSRSPSHHPRRESVASSSSSTSSRSRKRSHGHLNGDTDRIDHDEQNVPLRRDILEGVRYVEPSYNEIDAVMRHMDEDSDLGVERQSEPWMYHSPARSPARQPNHTAMDAKPRNPLLSHPHLRSGAPSPSPNRLRETFQYLPPTDSESADTFAREIVARNARFSPSYRPSRNDPNIQRLNSPGSTPPGDWNDMISSADEAKFLSRTRFFDHRVDNLVGDSIREKLGPIEKSITQIKESLAKLSSRSASRRPRSSGTVGIEHSDADDEDEDDEQGSGSRAQSRLKSPFRDRRLDQLKSSINELAASQSKLVSADQLAELAETMKQFKPSDKDTPDGSTLSNELKIVVEEAVGRQMRGRSAPVTKSSQAAAAEKSALQIAGLESMLKVAEDRAEEEMKARRATEDALADNQRLLRSALQEASEQRESAEATERSLQDYHSEHQQLLKRMATLEGSQDYLEKSACDLTDKNVALESTLNEYRLSSDKWRSDIDDARHENKDLRRQINSLQMENGNLVQDRQNLRSRFEHLQEALHASTRELTADQSKWKNVEEIHQNKLEMLGARLEAEARTRERLEMEIERLESQEKESMKARHQVEQALKANAYLDNLVDRLRSEGQDYQDRASRLDRELQAIRDEHSQELVLLRSQTKTDVEEARNHASIVRNEIQNVVLRLEKQVEDGALQAEESRSRHQSVLEDASTSRQAAVHEAAEAKERALQEQAHFHERNLESLKAQHSKAVEISLTEKQQSETYFGNRLNLADEKMVHYQDRIKHLEERLEIAKQAASAAVQATQAKKANTPASETMSPPRSVATPSMQLPDKISPQALRESIMVLQEQLQEREGRIEDLETQLSDVDLEAPGKLKDAEIEIAWLRELLGVRIDDLDDIISALSRPIYDRNAVKDAAIRLKANLQMEQQEKERATAGGNQILPNISSISSLAASPRALPLAAAAAWGNWRRGRDSSVFSSLGGIASNSAQQTPSKSSTSQRTLSSLMTPPPTDTRTPPQPTVGSSSRPTSSSSPKAMPGLGGPSTPRQSFSFQKRGSRPNSSNKAKAKAGPVTPPFNLMRNASYDMDAREGPDFNTAIDEDDAQNPDGFDRDGFQMSYEVGPGEAEPFGPKIGTFSS